MKKNASKSYSKSKLSPTYLENIETIKELRNSLRDHELTNQEVLEKFKTAVEVMREVIEQVNEFNTLIGETIQKKLDE